MESPNRITIDELRKQVTAFLKDKCDLTGSIATCAACQSPIVCVDCYVSIHVAEFTACAGPGTVEHIPIPYCRACEPKPAQSGCVHVPYSEGRDHIMAQRQLTSDISDFVLSTLIKRIRHLPTVE